MLFVNGEEEQLPSISLLEVRRACLLYMHTCAHMRVSLCLYATHA